MGEQFIVVSSITYAYKGREVLERRGCRVYIERAPRNISSCGCHFILRVRGCSVREVLAVLQAANVRVLGTGRDYG